MTQEFSVRTDVREQLVEITEAVRGAAEKSGVREGICLISVPHTTAGILVNENADTDVGRDLLSFLRDSVPRDSGFLHAEGNSDAHVKAVLAGCSATLPVRDGRPVLGTWQGIFLAEFDGPRTRTIRVTLVSG